MIRITITTTIPYITLEQRLSLLSTFDGKRIYSFIHSLIRFAELWLNVQYRRDFKVLVLQMALKQNSQHIALQIYDYMFKEYLVNYSINRWSSHLYAKHSTGRNCSCLVGCMTCVDALVTGMDTVEDDTSVTDNTDVVRNTFMSLSTPTYVRSRISTNLKTNHYHIFPICRIQFPAQQQ